MTALNAIHVKKRQLGLDDETYRALLERVTGKRSSADMDEGERLKVVAEMDRLGAPKASRPRRDRASGPFAPKLQALWIAACNLGVVRDRSDAAMIAFVKRQTGLEHTRFLVHAGDADKAIEALKSWIRRETVNEDLFTQDRTRPPLCNDVRFQIVIAQWGRLLALDAAPASSLAAFVLDRTGKVSMADLGKDDWIGLMNDLGVVLRAALAKRAGAA